MFGVADFGVNLVGICKTPHGLNWVVCPSFASRKVIVLPS